MENQERSNNAGLAWEKSIQHISIEVGLEKLTALIEQSDSIPTLDIEALYDEESRLFEINCIENGVSVYKSPVIYFNSTRAVGQLEDAIKQVQMLVNPSADVLAFPHHKTSKPVSAELEVYGGKIVDLYKPGRTQFDIDTIAHHLCHICRFGGATKYFYSVAQHSVHVSYTVPPFLAMQALMHDAQEAFVGDCPTPFKKTLEGFEHTENAIQTIIFAQIGLSLPLAPEVKQADLSVLKAEREILLTSDCEEHWSFLDDVIIADTDFIEPMSCEQAKQLFLNRYYELQSASVALV